MDFKSKKYINMPHKGNSTIYISQHKIVNKAFSHSIRRQLDQQLFLITSYKWDDTCMFKRTT